jgi:lipoyl(octanoyl) transferase
VLHRVDLGEVPYQESIEAMARWVAERQAGAEPDRLFLLSHPEVITYGKLTPPADLPSSDVIPTVPVDRGGHATYHGPGQLIGYLVMDLRQKSGPADVIRWLENGLIAAMASLGFDTIRRDTPKGESSLVGVWTPQHAKLVSIGMRIRGGVTSHGFALNINPDLTVFDRFTACSLPGVEMTSLQRIAEAQGQETPSDLAVRDAVAAQLAEGLRPREPRETAAA